MIRKSIIYINYSPYENSGHILDYLVENFERVFLFTLAFHKLGRNRPLNVFTIYEKGKLIKKQYLFYLDVPEKLVFFFIPIRSVLNLFQIMNQIIKVGKSYGKINIYFTVNAFTASVGRLSKWLGLVENVYFWVWDYYPLYHPSFTARISRFLYWQFDKFSTFSDKVFYLNHRMADIRKKFKIIPSGLMCSCIPIGMGKMLQVRKKSFKNIKIGFIGVLKKSQGVDMLIDSVEILSKSFDRVTFEIIGSGPDEETFRSKVKNSDNVKYNFYGYVTENKFKEILSDCVLGVSPYSPEKSSVSKYTDPGKPKRYIEFNLPVITTNVIEFSNEIKKYNAGVVVKYRDFEGFVKAIRRIIDNYKYYLHGVRMLHRKYFYRSLYNNMFSELG